MRDMNIQIMDQSAIETAKNNTIEKSAKKLHELLENLKQ